MRVAVLISLMVCASSLAHAEEDAAHFFETSVRPVLAEHCYSCHGPEKQKSDYRLDTPEGLFAGGSRGASVAPGDPAASLLIQALNGTDDLEMPPDGKLAQEQIDAITKWVADGAVWPDYDPAKPASTKKPPMDLEAGRNHWSFKPVARPALPEVGDAAWPRNEVDRFILARIEAAGEKPTPEADPATLLRRVTYDLTGLPPTPEAVQAFLGDDSPFAYEKAVDRLLASPQFGEHWARHWLDVVRYTDSFDSRASTLTDPAEIWRYRDWVVNAYNTDMPYDEFLRNQVAGDVLPGPDGGFNRDGLIATGALAIGHWPQGDADKQKMVTDIVDDQVDLVTRGFLGVTFACARCHDHKFDPFTAKDYYGLAGIFFSSSILPGPGAKTEGSPILHLPLASKEELAARAAREQRVNDLRGQIAGLLNQDRAAFAKAEAHRSGEYFVAALSGAADDATLNPDAVALWKAYTGVRPGMMDVLVRDVNSLPGLHQRHGGENSASASVNTTGKDQHYLTIDQPNDSLIVHPSPERHARIVWQSPIDGNVEWTARISDADGACGDGFAYRVLSRAGGVVTTLAEGNVDNGKLVKSSNETPFAVTAGLELVVEIQRRGDYSCDSTLVDWRLKSDAGDSWNLWKDVVPRFTEPGPWPDAAGRAGVWWLEDPAQATPEPTLFTGLFELLEAPDAAAVKAYADALQARVDAAAAAAPETPEAAAYAALTGEAGPFWLGTPPMPEGSARPTLEAELAGLESTPLPPLDLAVGIQEGGVPGTEHEGIRDVAIHKRGDYNNLGEVVPRRMPEVLTKEQPVIESGSGRIALAQWLSSRENPLTARVMANRIWLHLFGEGIVRTAGDFGSRGEAPTHPELLEHLASDLMDQGWRVKPIIRELVLSATYRQSARAGKELFEKDPENRLFARANRKRLAAEELRDSLLAAAGTLDLSPGGLSFKEFETPRRTLYLRNVRSDRSTFTALFDAADPTAIIPKRNEATIAPQALFMMNHPFVIAQAEALSAALAPASGDHRALAEALRLRLFARPARDTDIAQTTTALEQLGGAEHSLAAYCQVLLSSNEFMFVE